MSARMFLYFYDVVPKAFPLEIAQFRYIKIQPKTIYRPQNEALGSKLHQLCSYPQSHVLRSFGWILIYRNRSIGCNLYGSFIIVSRTKTLNCSHRQHHSDTRRHILIGLALCCRNTKQKNKTRLLARDVISSLSTVAPVMQVTINFMSWGKPASTFLVRKGLPSGPRKSESIRNMSLWEERKATNCDVCVFDDCLILITRLLDDKLKYWKSKSWSLLKTIKQTRISIEKEISSLIIGPQVHKFFTKPRCVYQTSHFFFGFMYDPSLHLNTSENSWKFDKVPITLQNKKRGI